MNFGGFQKLTLLDFPGKVACILFTKGCNFFCPYCHNSQLIDNSPKDNIEEDEVLSFLKKRQGILEGVCISGGEPLLHDGISAFLEKVKEMGYAVKLDTNGTFPKRLKELCQKGLVDYVAMDIKNSFSKYPLTAGRDVNIDDIKESIEFLLSGSVDYEFRTTLAVGLHTSSDMHEIGKMIKGAKRYFLQNFLLTENVPDKTLTPLDDEQIQEIAEICRLYVEDTSVRGV